MSCLWKDEDCPENCDVTSLADCLEIRELNRKYQKRKKLRLEGKLHSNEMTDYEKVRWLIDHKEKMENETL